MDRELTIADLVGRKVLSATINSSKDDIRLITETGTLDLMWEGDCCASCYLAHVSGSADLIGATILSAENSEWVDTPDSNVDDYDQKESMGTVIKTDKGTVTFESRLEHNGFYSGRINVTDCIEMVQNHSPLIDF